MVSDYDDAATYAEAFDKHLDFAGMHPSLAPEFRSICADADKEIAALRAKLKACVKDRQEQTDAIVSRAFKTETLQRQLDAANERVRAFTAGLLHADDLCLRLAVSLVDTRTTNTPQELSRMLQEHIVSILEQDAALAQPTGVVMDLDKIDWESIQKAASESTWMPKAYMRNDWVADVCNFLKHGGTPNQPTGGAGE